MRPPEYKQRVEELVRCRASTDSSKAAFGVVKELQEQRQTIDDWEQKTARARAGQEGGAGVYKLASGWSGAGCNQGGRIAVLQMPQTWAHQTPVSTEGQTSKTNRRCRPTAEGSKGGTAERTTGSVYCYSIKDKGLMFGGQGVAFRTRS